MGDYLFRATFPNVNGLARDAVTNSWSANVPSPADVLFTAQTIAGFYNTVPVGPPVPGVPHPVAFYMSTFLSRTALAASIAAYDRAAPPGSSPVVVHSFTLGASGGGNQLPNEVAAVLSIQADLSGGVNKRRRRGRLFLGPLIVSAFDSLNQRLEDNFLANVAAAAHDLLALSDTDPQWSWQVWSEADGVGRNVVDGYVDNAPDTQRRRGPRTTARVAWT